MTNPVELEAWQTLAGHYENVKNVSLREHFAADSERFEKFQLNAAGIFLDYSKNHINDDTLSLLMSMANESKVPERIQSMFEGMIVNPTENRPALHTALRNRSSREVIVDGRDVMPDVKNVLAKLRVFSEQIRSGEWTGFSGKSITDVVNIGIGGSDLGPLMAVEALAPFAHERLNLHFVSNVDGSHMVLLLPPKLLRLKRH